MMRKKLIFSLLVLGCCGFFMGCGQDDFQAGNRLTVESLTDLDGNSVPVFNAVTKTDDFGVDQDADVEDPDGSQGNLFPDPGEKVLVYLSDDFATITLRNAARLGVEEGVDLYPFRLDVSYEDSNGDQHAFAPPVTYDLTGMVPNNGTASFDFVLVPVDLKSRSGGLQEVFLTATEEELAAVRQWTVTVDVYAKDKPNDDTVHAQGRMSVRFINPMFEEVIGE